MNFRERTKLRCPNCGSLRITGDRLKFKCKACGFIHNSKKMKSN